MHEAAAPDVRFDGRYALRSPIGQGGKARVFLGRDLLLDRDVAIKVFRSRAVDAGELQVQEAEARLVASLNHHALTTLFDAGADTSDPERPQIYLVMEHVPGSDLRERLRHGPLPWLQVAYLGFDLAEGLAYLHEAGFLHRDIKPANVLLAARGADERLRGKLSDFGISSVIGQCPSGDGESITGTAAYLSPEQAEGHEQVPASDVYSLGLVLIEAVTGEVAFPGDVATSALARLDRDPLVPMTVPDGLRQVLLAMTARRPEQRMTPTAAAEALLHVVVDQLTLRRARTRAVTGLEEAGRLAALQRYDVLDTPAEDAFDDVTALVRQLLDVPIAAVAMLDTGRIWFKSRQGLAVPELARPTTLDVIPDDSAELCVIGDMLSDPRTRDNPRVAGDGGLRALAAAPLVTYDGHVIGRVTAFDHRPREFTAEQVEGLAICARIVMRELELRLASRRALFST